jgi:hypothetical protein
MGALPAVIKGQCQKKRGIIEGTLSSKDIGMVPTCDPAVLHVKQGVLHAQNPMQQTRQSLLLLQLLAARLKNVVLVW